MFESQGGAEPGKHFSQKLEDISLEEFRERHEANCEDVQSRRRIQIIVRRLFLRVTAKNGFY